MLKKYKSVHKFIEKEIIIKKSRFIASVLPTDSETEAIEFIEKIKKANKDAVHNVFAYQIGFNDEVQRQSDDGEPTGTAGIPVLEVIKKEKMKNLVIVVTRYFGGILLGAGGLIRAYSQLARAGIEEAGVVWKVLYQELIIDMDYTWLGKVQNMIMNEGCIVEDTEYTDVVSVTALTPATDSERIKKLLIELSSDKLVIKEGQKRYLIEKDGKIIN